jgi:hypothetical protein
MRPHRRRRIKLAHLQDPIGILLLGLLMWAIYCLA